MKYQRIYEKYQVFKFTVCVYGFSLLDLYIFYMNIKAFKTAK